MFDDRHASALRALDIRSELVVPLMAHGRVLGALTLAVAGPVRRFAQLHLELARAFANRLALALDNTRLYAEAQRAVAARDATLAVVAHDLRTPLGVIVMQTDVLQQQAASSERGADASGLAMIRRSAERMRRLIQDLVDAANVEAGRFSVERRPEAMAPVIAETVDALHAQAAARSLALEPPTRGSTSSATGTASSNCSAT